MRRISAPAVRPGSLIGIAAPATCIEKKLLLKGCEKLTSWGYGVRFDERILQRQRSFAGSDHVRASVLDHLVDSKSVRAIWCARGGYGVTRILNLLDDHRIAARMKKNPKLLIGYSDITALHLYFYQKIGLKSLHAPVLATKKWLSLPASQEILLEKILAGMMDLGRKSHTARWRTSWIKGHGRPHAVEGILLGGNLCLLANLAGTKWQPNLHGAILFIEDCGEAPYRIDRMLTQMRNSGMLDGVRAVVAGDLTADVVLQKGEKKTAWKDVLEDRLCARGIPVITGAPVGHGARNEPLPLGVKARITKAGRLEILEQVVEA